MKDFAIGFLLASTLAFGTYTTYALFCPVAKQSKTGVIMMMMPMQDLLPPTKINPKNNDA